MRKRLVRSFLQTPVLLLALMLLGLLAYHLFADKSGSLELPAELENTASLYPNPKNFAGQLVFVDDARKMVELSKAAEGRWSLLYFGYTSCPDVCPIDLAILNQVTKRMKSPESLQVFFVSVDPNRDIGRLNAFAQHFNPNFKGLSAEDGNLDRITKAMGVYHEIVEVRERAAEDHSHEGHAHNAHAGHAPEGEHYLIDHTASFLLLNPNLDLVSIISHPFQVNNIARVLDLIIKG